MSEPVKNPKSPAKNAKPIAPKVKKPKPKGTATHPPVSMMIMAAIKSMEHGGSSLQAIKKYLAANYKVNCKKLTPFIHEFLKNAVVSGQLVQTSGRGASGTFKLPAAVKEEGGEKTKDINPKAEPAAKDPKTKLDSVWDEEGDFLLQSVPEAVFVQKVKGKGSSFDSSKYFDDEGDVELQSMKIQDII